MSTPGELAGRAAAERPGRILPSYPGRPAQTLDATLDAGIGGIDRLTRPRSGAPDRPGAWWLDQMRESDSTTRGSWLGSEQ